MGLLDLVVIAGYVGLMERERKRGRKEERWERRGRSELFFLFDGVVYIILISSM